SRGRVRARCGSGREEIEMISSVKDIEYFTIVVADKPGEARKFLEFLSEKSVNLLALTAFPLGEGESRIDFFPEDPSVLMEVAEDAEVAVTGPRKAFLVQGEDKIGAFYDFHLKLANARINVHACNGVVDGTGRFGYVIWVDPADHEEASKVLRSSDWRTIQPSPRK
ncbi:hypothetical protein ACFL41_02315, partial [Gemmatimonadota bacterium]